MQVRNHHKCETATVRWTPTDTPGVERKELLATAPGVFSTFLLRLAPGASVPVFGVGFGVEALVLEGSWVLPEGTLAEGGYSRRPAEQVGEDRTTTGCTLFVRTGPFAAADREVTHVQTREQSWLPGHGHLRVKPLHAFGSESSALVHWPAGERFIPHKHWGGEEIFVLSGTFKDEHGDYPEGTWLLSPHLSTHHPFVEEETVIFVKTGHVGAAIDEGL